MTNPEDDRIVCWFNNYFYSASKNFIEKSQTMNCLNQYSQVQSIKKTPLKLQRFLGIRVSFESFQMTTLG